MLKFGYTTIFAAALLIVTIAADIIYGVPVYLYAALFLLYSLAVFYGCYFIGSDFFIHVICSANTDKKEIAISFDDGPAEYTPQILQILKDSNIKSAFFCIGRNIKGNEEVLKQLHQEGHIIGNHSFSHHFWFDMFPYKKMIADLQLMDVEVKEVIGLQPKLFRPPYGVTNPTVRKSIINGSYTPVGWSVRSMDTVTKDEERLLEKINGKIKPGAVFLFHDTSKVTLNILPAFIKQVKENGYQIVRLDKMLNLQPYA